jgi:hypothetical protein
VIIFLPFWTDIPGRLVFWKKRVGLNFVRQSFACFLWNVPKCIAKHRWMCYN